MSAKVCKACGGPRRGGRRATIIGEGWRGRGMVCRLCAQGGTLLVVLIKRRKKSKKRHVLKADLAETFGLELGGGKLSAFAVKEFRSCDRCGKMQTVTRIRAGTRMAIHRCPHGLPCQKISGDPDNTPTCLVCTKDKNTRERSQVAADTAEGIFVRADPSSMPCEGKGPEHES